MSIEHTEAEGTLLHGTARGDGSAEVVKGLGWRWGRSIGSWYLPRSRDVPPRRPLIETTAQRLREAGHEVEVSIDTTLQDRGEREQRITQLSQNRVDRLESRADQEEDLSEQRYAAYRQISDHIPLGQPILLGHHSQARAERDHRRMGSHMDASVEHQRQANEARAAANSAQANQRHRRAPVTVANRIERLGADVRRLERTLAGMNAHGVPEENGHRQSVEDRLAIDRADLEHWKQVRADQIASGEATDYSRDTVAVGDLVKIRGSWRTVARANAKTVSVETGYSWTDKAPWHAVQDHRPRETTGEHAGRSTNQDSDRAPSPLRRGGVEHEKREAPGSGAPLGDLPR
nr:DUF3560 domain-containing protein [Ornithinimicrobium sp. F0845]